jgi:hypothetical protein
MSGEDWNGCSRGARSGANNSDLKVTLAEVHTKKGRSDDWSALLEGVLRPRAIAYRAGRDQGEARRLLEKLKWSI